ncbi:MAG: discoidin domain-containing protein [Candidatus Riflebacteria bacterium]
MFNFIIILESGKIYRNLLIFLKQQIYIVGQNCTGESTIPKSSNGESLIPESAETVKLLSAGKTARQSSVSQWSNANDSQGGVDGVKNGGFGFHTASQPNPWWEVDLGAVAKLNEIVIFNRIDYNPERSRTIQVLLSGDGKTWQTFYKHDGTIFGGKDGRPLRVSLKGSLARFVRLQLAEETYFHLDEVEIFGNVRDN